MATIIRVVSPLNRRQAASVVRRFVTALRTKTATPNKAILAGYIAANVLRENADDFDRKSQGGADRFGDVWPPLAASTIARKLQKLRKLTRNQRRTRYDKVYQLALQQYGQRLSPKAAAEMARRMAWQAIAGPTFINIATWRLRRSLQWTTTLETRFAPAPDQVARIDRNRLEIGTSVPYAKFTHYGTKKQPARPVLVGGSRVRPWVRTGVANARAALAEALAVELR